MYTRELCNLGYLPPPLGNVNYKQLPIVIVNIFLSAGADTGARILLRLGQSIRSNDSTDYILQLEKRLFDCKTNPSHIVYSNSIKGYYYLMDNIPIFNSVEDECRYWKERARFYLKEWNDTKQEFDEYVEDSKQLEGEMEATLDQKECLLRELKQKSVLYENECDVLKVKLETVAVEFKNMEKQLSCLRTEKDNMRKYLRQLEQQNDDLERGYRILSESIAGVKTDLDKAYEKNALLEIEVDEKEMLQEKLQRLMDETRDLKQELDVKERLPCTSKSNTDSLAYPGKADKTIETKIASYCQSFDRPKKFSDGISNGNLVPASSRTTALNIVADMLRKLNAMESKLKDYREHPPGPRQ